jgi:hypothetical protein
MIVQNPKPSGEPISIEKLAELSVISRRDISEAIAKGTQRFRDWLSQQQGKKL